MLFGFFTRKSEKAAAASVAVAGSTTGDPFAFSARQSHLLTPASSVSSPPAGIALPEETPFDTPPPPPTPSPPPRELVEDPSTLYALVSSVPPQTLHAYCLHHLNPSPIHRPPLPTPPKSRRGGASQSQTPTPFPGANDEGADDNDEEEEDPQLSPETLTSLTHFFRALVPPPQLHCVRCHKAFFDLDNTDTSCRVPHDDDSAIVERIGLITDAATFETLWGCCGGVVEGDGAQGPPDGWCYEGRHTVDLKRARFRADATLHDDKLVSCAKRRCFKPPALQARTTRSAALAVGGKARKRGIQEVLVKEEKKEQEDDRSVTSSVKRRRRGKKVISPAEVEDDSDDEEEETQRMDVDVTATPPTRSPPASPHKPRSARRTASRPRASTPPRTRSASRKPRSKLGLVRSPTRQEVFVEIRCRSKSASPVRPGSDRLGELGKQMSGGPARDGGVSSDCESERRGRRVMPGRSSKRKALGEVVDSSIVHEMEMN